MSKVTIIATPSDLTYYGIDTDLSGTEVTLTGKEWSDNYVQIECPPSKVMQEVGEMTNIVFDNRLYDIPRRCLSE